MGGGGGGCRLHCIVPHSWPSVCVPTGDQMGISLKDSKDSNGLFGYWLRSTIMPKPEYKQ